VIGYSAIADMAGGILFFDKTAGALSSTAIKNVSSNFDGLSRDDRLRYDTPKFYGVSLAASHVTDDQWDVAVFQSGKFGDFKVAGAASYADPNN
ncbi:MAG: porin, partial [Desulfuromonadales bacterium]|nr:porin [Desulfuromonadales bacterium]